VQEGTSVQEHETVQQVPAHATVQQVPAPATVQQVPAPEPPKKSTTVKEGNKARRFKYARRPEPPAAPEPPRFFATVQDPPAAPEPTRFSASVQEPSAAPEPPRFPAIVQDPPPAPEPTRLCAKIVQRPDDVSPFKIQQVHTYVASNSLPEKIVSEFYDSLPASQREPQIGPDVFDDLPDHVLAAITDQMMEAVEKDVRTVKLEKHEKNVNTLKKTLGLKKPFKPKTGRKSSRLMKLKTKACKGEGSNIDQPMVIDESEEGTLTQEDNGLIKDGTCLTVLRGLPKLVMRKGM